MIKAKLLGATAAAESLAIEDVFSTYLYTGNGSTQTITNGIDLAGEGGLVWAKARSLASRSHRLFDTVRGENSALSTDLTNAASLGWDPFFNFTSAGFSFVSLNDGDLNASGSTYASWTFRQAPRFFDVVTYTGTGANRTIAHDLGVVPGCIIVKRTDTTGDWQVYHRSLANTEYLVLNSTAAKATGATRWNSTTPTSSVFSIGTDATVNASGGTYVAYLFAHDPLGPSGDGSDGLIACGSYTGTGAAGNTINLGWEPQWLIIKCSSTTRNWLQFDNMRGLVNGGNDNVLFPNLSSAESASGYVLDPLSNGFSVGGTDLEVNGSGQTYTYIAIRRGPMRKPTSGTEVFAPYVTTSITPSGSTSNNTTYNVGFPVDFLLQRNKNGTDGTYVFSRLTGQGRLKSETTAAEGTAGAAWWDSMVGAHNYNPDYGTWNFRRAPGFFDVVAYTGTGVTRTINHNLGVAPELMIIKSRSAVNGWVVYAQPLGNTGLINLNWDFAAATGQTVWNSTTPSSSTFSVVGSSTAVNQNGTSFIAYLFASLPGISKIGSYTGNGSNQTINCGFTTGARFILIKRTDSTGDWYVWDTARGIVTGNDPHLSLNTTAAEVTTNDTIDPDSTGFIVNQVAATNVNVNAATYIYLAIA